MKLHLVKAKAEDLWGFKVHGGSNRVKEVFAASPAEEAGLQVEDDIVSIGGKTTISAGLVSMRMNLLPSELLDLDVVDVVLRDDVGVVAYFEHASAGTHGL